MQGTRRYFSPGARCLPRAHLSPSLLPPLEGILVCAQVTPCLQCPLLPQALRAAGISWAQSKYHLLQFAVIVPPALPRGCSLPTPFPQDLPPITQRVTFQGTCVGPQWALQIPQWQLVPSSFHSGIQSSFMRCLGGKLFTLGKSDSWKFFFSLVLKSLL